MSLSALHEFHQGLNARFTTVNGAELPADYGDGRAEHLALHRTAGVLDLSARSRLCLLGADRLKFLHGQVTNDVQRLNVGEGCYAALVNAKGRLQSDLNIYRLPDELLLDFEPGFSETVARRLEQYIIADDVQLVDAAPHYGLLSVQGPRAQEVVTALELGVSLPTGPLTFACAKHAAVGDIYVMNHPRAVAAGFDLFVPLAGLAMVFDKLIAAAKAVGGRVCGWEALELARLEAGIPRFGVDMEETNLAPEAGIETRAISYAKGCYIGQEVIARIRTYGQVAKALRGLRLADGLAALPVKGDKLVKDGKEVGYLTSVGASPILPGNIALGYVRRECNSPGTTLEVATKNGSSNAQIVELPFVKTNAGAV